MSTLLHLVRKDFHHWWRTLAVWFSILVLSIAWDTKMALWLEDPEGFAALPDPALDDSIIWFLSGSLVVAIELMVRAAIVSKLVHEDATVGSREFWMSRPISGGTLLASKAIGLVLGLVLPTIVLRVAVKGVFTGVFALSSIDVLFEVVVVAWLTVLAALTPSLARMVLAGGTLTVAGFGGFLALVWLVGPMLGGIEAVPWPASSLAWLAFVAVCCATTCHQYLTRRTMRSMIGAVLGTSVSLLVLWEFWVPETF